MWDSWVLKARIAVDADVTRAEVMRRCKTSHEDGQGARWASLYRTHHVFTFVNGPKVGAFDRARRSNHDAS
jgi:hypothetical protein